MNQATSTQEQISQYFQKHIDIFSAEAQIISDLKHELSAKHSGVTNKSMISALLVQLETEPNVLKQDVLRGALEIVVMHTADDSDLAC